MSYGTSISHSKPITSYGILCFKLLNNFEDYNSNIQFLLVRRKYSLNYIDFIRGKYDINDINSILNMFNYMSSTELALFSNDFNTLWNNLWKKTANIKLYSKEKTLSCSKFNKLKDSGAMTELLKLSKPYDTPEWEIPKGRRNTHETDIECAMREFTEETQMNSNNYTILDYKPICDNFIGTNNKEYQHVFYIGKYISDYNVNKIDKNNEIDEIRWCNLSDSINLIRPYNQNKINILTKLFYFICKNNEPCSI
jgi:8-oxo-dGTP pyrophosphatase MutT (NUDIX family)